MRTRSLSLPPSLFFFKQKKGEKEKQQVSVASSFVPHRIQRKSEQRKRGEKKEGRKRDKERLGMR